MNERLKRAVVLAACVSGAFAAGCGDTAGPSNTAASGTPSGTSGLSGTASAGSAGMSGASTGSTTVGPAAGSTGAASGSASGGPSGSTGSSAGGVSSGTAAGSMAGAKSGSTAGSTSGAATGATSGSKSGSTTGSTAGSGSGSTTGSTTGSSAGTSGTPAAQVFPACRFHYGAIDSIAKGGGASLISQLDMFTSGWIGSSTGLPTSVCNESAAGAPLAGKVPALVAYIISFSARNDPGWCLADCNANNAGCQPASDLCTKGADYIRQNFTTRILPEYVSYAQGFAQSCGTTRPIIWEMEPDFYQYYAGGQGGGSRGQPGGPFSVQEAVNYMHQMIAAVKQILPNAVFSMDISPWMPTNGSGWYPNFNLSDITFISTSGGGTSAGSTLVRTTNGMTWAGVHGVAGKPILADTGYGAAGGSAGPDQAWDVAANINARIADGVVAITQYNPSASTWGATIASTRPNLNAVQCY